MQNLNNKNKNQNNNNGKVLFVLGILLAIIILIGFSYAIYIFAFSGIKENVITTGEIDVNYTENNYISLSNQFPKTDTDGINNTEEESILSFSISSNVSGSTQVNYVIALDAVTEGATLTDSYVKIYLTKNNAVANEFTEGTGRKINDFKLNFVQDKITSYAVLTDSLIGQTVHNYTLRAWISDDYSLPQTDISEGVSHGVETNSEVFSFKIKVIATEDALVISNDTVPPTCGTISGASTTWTSSDRTITIECNDDSGCAQATYSTTFNTTTEVGTIEISDIAGNTTSCPVNAYVDKSDYTITVNQTTGGTVTVSKATAKIGDTITVTGQPSSGYMVGTITYNGNTISGGSFVMPRGNVVVTASWIPQTLTISPNASNVWSTGGTSGSSRTVTFNSNNMYVHTDANGRTFCYGYKTYDLTNYNNLVVSYSTNAYDGNGDYVISILIDDTTLDFNIISSTTTIGFTRTVNISSYTGSHIIKIGAKAQPSGGDVAVGSVQLTQ